MKNKVIAAFLAVLTVVGTSQVSFAATEHYNDSSAVASEEDWNNWVSQWETLGTRPKARMGGAYESESAVSP